MKKVVALVLALVLTFALVACGNKKDDLSGNLVLYSTMTENDLNALLDCFGEKYPNIEVEVVNGSAGELVTRITGEAANPVGDLVWGGMADSDGKKNEAIFEAWVSEYDAQNLEGYTSPNGLYSMDHLSTVVFCVNKDIEAKLGLKIESYEDLLNPALKGQILTADPNSSSSAWNNLSNIMAVYGNDSDAAWAYIEKLMPNLVVVGSSSACFKQVQQGEYCVGMTYEDGAVTLVKDGATNIRLQYPTNGTSASAFGCALIKNGPNPDNAKAMIDFICSAEGQTALAAAQEGTLRYTNAGYTNPDNAWLAPSSDIKWVVRDVAFLTENKAKILEKWNDLWAKVSG
ncbi:MAG: extracellular solute-binding protein [Oscillospiraceae bacterium]|nr:extracellular solute-binding protein [Oscillospiraceae bacterium]